MELIFHNNFVKNVQKCEETGNNLFSPESVASLFNTTFQGYDEISQEFLLTVFCRQQETISKSFDLYDHKLWKKTKIFIGNPVNLPDEIRNNLETTFGCEIEEIDEKNFDSLNSIKNWISDNMVDSNCDIFGKPNINNIISCNFQWHANIEANTSNNKFHQENATSEEEFVNISGEFGYVEAKDLDAKIVEIPLSNENLKTILILPNSKGNIRNLESKLSGYRLQQLFNITQCQMTVSIPKIKFQHELNLKDLFYKMSDDIQYPFKFGENYHVGAVKTFSSIEISETDIKATAATGCELLLDPVCKELIFDTTIANRFAKTLITNKMENLEDIPQETTFSVDLPEDAFITEFVMDINGEKYKSYVKEKEEAKDIYDKAVAKGRSAACVTVSTRDSNKFTISVNLEPNSEIEFLLTYEELLRRRYDQYELVLNIQPGNLVNVLQCVVKIQESKNLKFIKTPAIKTGNKVIENEDTNSLSKIEISDSTGLVSFEPDLDQQKQIAQKLGLIETKGICGQFVVQYDIELDPSNGEVLINDGYFVHFYAPDDLPPLPEHIVFALDTSTSMLGKKIDQLKDAMQCILDQIKTDDLVDILDFNSKVSVHDIDAQVILVINYKPEENYHEPFYKYTRIPFPVARPANSTIIEKAKGNVRKMAAKASTNIIGALETALFLVKKRNLDYPDYQPLIIFLTDGMPSEGILDTKEIIKLITKLNHNNNKAPLFSLSFGEEADKTFLRKLSLDNFGFFRQIYEDSDASLQLQQFYKQISSPLLSNVTFKYDINLEDVTKTTFPIYFKGTDIVICGKCGETDVLDRINLCRPQDNIQLMPNVKKSESQIERLWAYLTVKQLLEQRENAEDKTELTKKALDLAIKYSFVTKITSLVVVKPEAESVVDIETPSFYAPNQGQPAWCVQSVKMKYSHLNYCYAAKRCADLCCCLMPLKCATLCWELMKKTRQDGRSDEIVNESPNPSLPVEIVADHPFLIMIIYKLDGKYVILFMARITGCS